MPCELTALVRIGGPVWIWFIPNSKLALGFLRRINSKGQSPVLCLQAIHTNAPFLAWEKEPAAARRLPEAKETKTVVSFCSVSEDNGSITTINHSADCNSHENGWEQLLTAHYVLSYPLHVAKSPILKIGFSRSGRTRSQHTTECFLHSCVCCCTTHTSQAVENESMCLSAVDSLKAMWCVYIHKGASLNHKEEAVPFPWKWMAQETIM